MIHPYWRCFRCGYLALFPMPDWTGLCIFCWREADQEIEELYRDIGGEG